jgi:hypothetical protein
MIIICYSSVDGCGSEEICRFADVIHFSSDLLVSDWNWSRREIFASASGNSFKGKSRWAWP